MFRGNVREGSGVECFPALFWNICISSLQWFIIEFGGGWVDFFFLFFIYLPLFHEEKGGVSWWGKDKTSTPSSQENSLILRAQFTGRQMRWMMAVVGHGFWVLSILGPEAKLACWKLWKVFEVPEIRIPEPA
ncbi:hypothetical protein BO94DRAFT_236731 [Aspergillus sclerotioniger CBS 115572]|uniref:Uncharacterized protein n=1 Tax=Aspergillus sclerotioniger CBS 115572 TaxID=1450535 RepID=A0A317VHI8_9EURO|nr:hypothetical protein BO94DRAFT_236731 [Aspergillus sclerotioniger CBS 115572]PWY73834.1 hypothetical protein BO94DRAFT_236731 [Aspergillus sclerotioniger CBS 115572]